MIVTLFVVGLLLILLGVFIIVKDRIIPGFSKIFSLIQTLAAGEKNWLESLSDLIDKIPEKERLAVILILIGSGMCIFSILASPAGNQLWKNLIKMKNNTKA